MINFSKKTLPEILEYVSEFKGTRAEKQELLRNACNRFQLAVLPFLYNPELTFNKLKNFKYESNIPPGMGVTGIEKHHKLLTFLLDSNDTFSLERKREKVYLLFQTLDKKEVELVKCMFNKKTYAKGITQKFLFDTFVPVFVPVDIEDQ